MKKSTILEKFSNEVKKKGQSENTRNIYNSLAKIFILDNHPDTIDKLSFDYLDKYLLSILDDKSPSSYNQYLSVLKILYRDVLNHKYKLSKLKPIKIKRQVKDVFSIDYFLDCVGNVENKKHRTIFLFLISTGVRISELLNVKLSDIKRNDNKILIRNGKGGRSWFAPARDDLILLLEKYYIEFNPKEFLFEGSPFKKYSNSSVNSIIKKHFGKQYSCHDFRRYYITYMIDNNVNPDKLSPQIGHLSRRSIDHYYRYSNKSIEREINPIREMAIL